MARILVWLALASYVHRGFFIFRFLFFSGVQILGLKAQYLELVGQAIFVGSSIVVLVIVTIFNAHKAFDFIVNRRHRTYQLACAVGLASTADQVGCGLRADLSSGGGVGLVGRGFIFIAVGGLPKFGFVAFVFLRHAQGGESVFI